MYMAYKLGSLFDGSIEWRPIKGYENEYLVSEAGDVWSLRSKRKLKPSTDKYGYFYFVLCVDGRRKTVKAHRLVAIAFIENPLNKPTVNHLNGVRNDNRVGNLEWATEKEQIADAMKRDAFPNMLKNTDYQAMGEKRNFGRRKTAVYLNGELLGIYSSLLDASKKQGINYSKASECANGKRKTTGGKTVCFV